MFFLLLENILMQRIVIVFFILMTLLIKIYFNRFLSLVLVVINWTGTLNWMNGLGLGKRP